MIERGPQIVSTEPPRYAEGEQFVARIQPFSRGGYEGSCYRRDADAWRHNPLQLVSSRNKTVKDAAKVREASVTRARRRVRWLCREVAADHLVTFTTREESNDPKALMRQFEQFVRRYREKLEGKPWLYVAVSEPHPTNPNHWHIHVACRGGVMIRTATAIWWKLCGGRGQGNVDVKRFKTLDGDLGSMALARYVSKYVSKGFGDSVERDEKTRRFRAAIIPLVDRHALILAADAPELALRVLLKTLRLGRGDIQVFMYRDGSGFWFSCNGEDTDDPPPF